MAKQQVLVPDIGGAEGAEVIELLVAVGDEVDVEQSLIVLESDKASMEIPSTAAGTVVELLVSEGQELSEGAPILVLESSATSEASEAEASKELTEAVHVEEQPEEPAATPPAEATPALSERTVEVPDIGSDEPVDLIEISVAVGDHVAEGGVIAGDSLQRYILGNKIIGYR